MSKTRIYKVATEFATPGGEVVVQDFLVDATSRQVAERHVAAKFIKGEVANGRGIAAMMAKGATVEQANADTETAPLPGVE